MSHHVDFIARREFSEDQRPQCVWESRPPALARGDDPSRNFRRLIVRLTGQVEVLVEVINAILESIPVDFSFSATAASRTHQFPSV